MNRRRASLLSAHREPTEPVIDLRREFSRELARSRRFGQSVSVLAAPTANAAQEREVFETLELHLRRYDVVGRLDGAVVVLAPDTGRSEADALLARLDTMTTNEVASSLGVAVAPQDGDELDAVLQIAMNRSLTRPGGIR